MRQNALQTSDLVTLYTKQHLTLRQIAPIAGMSHTAVAKRLKVAGVKSEWGEHVRDKCAECDKFFVLLRCRWKVAGKNFCSNECRNQWLRNPDYVQSRHGTRVARGIVAQFFDLQPGHVVHHEDSNQKNNNLANLKVFANQSDHLKYHHGKTPVQPLWECSPCPTPPTRNF